MVAPRSIAAGMRCCVQKAQFIRDFILLIDPVMSTRFEINKLCGLKPQIDLLLSTFYRVTAMNDVPVKKANHKISKKVSVALETVSNLSIWTEGLEIHLLLKS